jgi:hypothetical protein
VTAVKAPAGDAAEAHAQGLAIESASAQPNGFTAAFEDWGFPTRQR